MRALDRVAVRPATELGPEFPMPERAADRAPAVAASLDLPRRHVDIEIFARDIVRGAERRGEQRLRRASVILHVKHVGEQHDIARALGPLVNTCRTRSRHGGAESVSENSPSTFIDGRGRDKEPMFSMSSDANDISMGPTIASSPLSRAGGVAIKCATSRTASTRIAYPSRFEPRRASEWRK